jgi:hypothetical protein
MTKVTEISASFHNFNDLSSRTSLRDVEARNVRVLNGTRVALDKQAQGGSA